MENVDYNKILKEQGSIRKAAAHLGLTKSKFMVAYKKQLGLCTATTSCQNQPALNRTRCPEHLKYALYTRDESKKRIYSKKWRDNNKEYIREKAKEYYYKNHEYRRAYAKRYYKENYKEYNREKRARYRAAKKGATPSWISKKVLKKVYKNCPEGYHVDHIIPLTHYDVCGLHVPWNLQYLPSHVNESKANSFDGTYENTTWMDSFSHQYKRRLLTTNQDIKDGMPFNLSARDFELKVERMSPEIKEFIKKYEWLGTIGWAVRWSFTARYKGKLAGVVLISEPTNYTKHLDKECQALIQRGAASSWAPKNLNSKLLMFSINWMKTNTPKRIFYGYSDPDAGEIGTIYQACNFKYLGNTFGSLKKYILPNGRAVSEQYFNSTRFYKVTCKKLGIQWKDEWSKENGFKNINTIPNEVIELVKSESKIIKDSSKICKNKPKGKYYKVAAPNRRELKKLKNLMQQVKTFPFPSR